MKEFKTEKQNDFALSFEEFCALPFWKQLRKEKVNLNIMDEYILNEVKD